MRYEVYHDESKIGGYWHGLLFIPENKKRKILELLYKIRRFCKYKKDENVQFKGLSTQGKQFKVLWASLQFLSLATRRVLRGSNEIYLPHSCREGMEYKEICKIMQPLGVRFYILRSKKGVLKKMNYYKDYASKIETIFRFALKGASHFMFNEEEPIYLTKISFDGHDHYNRRVDKKTVLKYIPEESRDYFSLDPGLVIDDRHLKNRAGDDSFALINLADNLIGAWRCLIGTSCNSTQQLLVKALNPLYKRWRTGEIIFKSPGRWHKSFAINECFLKDDGKWGFERLGVEKEGTQKLSF